MHVAFWEAEKWKSLKISKSKAYDLKNCNSQLFNKDITE